MCRRVPATGVDARHRVTVDVDLDSLYLLVTDAILRADVLADLNLANAPSTHLEVSVLEARIAEELPADDAEGGIARRGAVRAAVAAGDLVRARALVELYSSDAIAPARLREELRLLLEAEPMPQCIPEKGVTMAGKGELYQRHDKKWAFRVKASNGEVVATDGGQGYEAKESAKSALEKLMRGDYNGPVEEVWIGV